MKKGILAFILMLGAFFCAFGQNSGPIDLVLLLDTSSSMGSSYDKVNDYITGSFLSEFLRTGDTFHLITFSASPRLDIARRISARGDIETIIGRMLIQYPVESGNDVSAAVNYADSYISTLPPRPKKIVMVSAAGPETSNVINSAKQRFSSKNATFDFVSVTGAVQGTKNLSNPPGSGRSSPRQSGSSQPAASSQQAPSSTGVTTRPSSPDSSSGTVATTSPRGTSDTQTGTQGTGTQGTGTQGTGTQGTGTQGTGTQGTGTQGASTQGTTQGASQTGSQSATQPSSSQDSSGSSTQGTSSQDVNATGQTQDYQDKDTFSSYSTQTKQKSSRSFYPSMPMILGIIGAILLLFLIILFASRRLGSSPNRVMASVSTASLAQEKEERFADHSKDLANYAARQSKQRVTPYQDRPIKQHNVATQPFVINPTGPLLLNLFVVDQNTAIGKRNIHSLKSGYSLTVGGGKSDDFWVFLVPLPPHLGDIRRNGSQLTFIPRKPKYFPDIGSNEVRDCINKRIRIISDKNYELWLSFVMYEDPLIALNRVLHSIKVPG